jgi:hypothetical protein
MDGVFHAKKYFVPLAVFQPFVAGGVAATYYLGGRFDPAKNTALWFPDGSLDQPLSKDDRRAWQRQLDDIVKSDPTLKPAVTKSAWKPLEASSEVHMDAAGHPTIQLSSSERTANLGATRSNIFASPDSQTQARLLLVARLHEELRGGRTKKASNRTIQSDFSLLQQSSPSLLAASSGGN